MALTQYFYHTDPSFRELNIIMAWMLESGAAVVYKIFVCGAAILYIALHSDEQYAKIASWVVLILYILLMARSSLTNSGYIEVNTAITSSNIDSNVGKILHFRNDVEISYVD